MLQAYRTRLPALLLAVLAAGCATGHNYPDPDGPRYRGGTAVGASRGDTLTVVSFNVRYAEEVDSAVAVLLGEPELRAADVVLLQEMDAPSTARIAEALGMEWVYYPAAFKSRVDKDFGNAVLSRFPIVDDHKVVLPHLSIFGQDQRIAVAAILQVGDRRITAYSVHLATPVNQALAERRDQMDALLDDAGAYAPVILGGDFNTGSFGEVATRRGWHWPTRDGPRTVVWGRWDHIFVRGLDVPAAGASGTVEDNRGASDHRPVWARVVLR